MPKNQAIQEFSNIRVTNDGYQVVLARARQEFTQYFAGHSPKSLRAAQRCRDRMLRELPNKRLHLVPKWVLKALGLSEPVVGVFRPAGREHYSVNYPDRTGRIRSRAFSWKGRSEAEAYAEAIALRARCIGRAGSRGRSS